MKIVYVSGCYRSKWGLIGKLLNIWHARRVAQQLWREGWAVICPHMNTALFPEDGIDYIGGDCEIIRRLDPHTDGILMLKNWQKSWGGTRRELAVALDRGLEVYWE